MGFYYLTELESKDFPDGGRLLLPQDDSKAYPVLYLIHGLGGIGDWLNSGSGNILDRMEQLTSSGKINPMILVMPYIKNDSDRSARPYLNYRFCDLMGCINKKYPTIVKTGRENTGIVGVSMGASAALYHAVKHTDMFYHMAALGPATVTSTMVKPEEFVLRNDPDSVHFVGYGTAEGAAFEIADKYVIENFKKNNVDIVVRVHEGTGHSFQTFGPQLDEFLSMIFKA